MERDVMREFLMAGRAVRRPPHDGNLALAPLPRPDGGQRTARPAFRGPPKIDALQNEKLRPRIGPGFGFWILHSAFCIFLAFGCSPEEQRSAPVQSKFFSRVRIIGTRGTGIGEFNKPRSVAVDALDNLYVVDMTGRVQKFSPEGVYLLNWQMPQTDKGKPKGMCRDGQGNIVVIEPHYSRVNHFSTEGKLVAQWGVQGTNFGQLGMPRAAAVNSKGEIYVAEYTFSERVQRFSTPGGKCEGCFGRLGDQPGEFSRAEGLGIDGQDRVYVADSCNHRIEIFSPDGRFLRAHGKAGSGPGEFSYPYDVRVDSEGRQYVCEFGNSRLQIFDADDHLLEILGGPGGEPGQFSNPWAIALDSKRNLYVADSMNHRVQEFLRK
jgi:DNA-binding beta-propeller fold protein YncE